MLKKILQAQNLPFCYLVANYHIYLLKFFNYPVFCIVITKTWKILRYNRLLQTFHEINESSQLEYVDQNKILRLFIYCFSKVYALHESDKVRMKQKNIKRKRVTYE